MLDVRLWRHPAYVRFFLGAGLSTIGNWFSTVAVPVLLFRLTGQVSAVAVTIAVLALPRMFLAPLAGALADRFERRRMLIAIDGARAVLTLVPLLAHSATSAWLIYVAVFLLQVGTCLYNPAESAYIPEFVPDELLEAANAAYSTMRDVGIFVGPALASLLLATWGISAAFWTDAASFVVSACILLTLPRAARSAGQSLRPRALIAGYLTVVRRYPRVTALACSYVAAVLPIFYFQAVVVAYARVLGQSASFVGLLYAAAGAGGIVGGLVMGRYLRRLPYTAAIIIFALSVPALGLLAFVRDVPLALFTIACSAAAGTTGDLAFTVGVQRDVSAEERGRAFGLWSWCIGIGQVAGAVCGMLVATPQAVSALLWISVAAFPFVLASVWLSITSKRSAGIVAGIPVAKGVP